MRNAGKEYEKNETREKGDIDGAQRGLSIQGFNIFFPPPSPSFFRIMFVLSNSRE